MAFSTTSAAGTGAGGAPGGDYHTRSEIDVTEVSGSHTLIINGYSWAKGLPRNEFMSSSFTFIGRSWSIRFYPNGYSTTNDDATDYVSIYLTGPDVIAQFSISLLNKTSPSVTYYTKIMVPFIRMSSQRGFQKFVKKKQLEQSGCIKDDSFRILCNITIVKVIKHEDAITTTAAKVVDVLPSDLVQHLGNLLSTGDVADVVFEVGGETLRAHRSILAARSPVFKAELFSPMKEGTATCVWINDMEPGVFRALLDFIYTDVFPENVEEGDTTMVMAQHLLVAADRYGMDRLKLMCEDKLCGYIDIGTAGTILALAEQHGCRGLKKKCLDFLMSGNNLMAAIVTGGFEHITNSCPSILKELLLKLTVTASS